jgi:DNA repair protein RecO (recombination protein O)
LEPFFRLRMILHEGRSELLTVTSAETLAAHGGLREHGASLDAAARACDAVARLFGDGDPHPAAYNLLANELALLDAEPGHATLASALTFRLKLLLAAGFAPQLTSCASCGEHEHLSGFSGAAGGVVCDACESSAFALDGEAHGFLVEALARPLERRPSASDRALRQVERAIGETAEHHAGVKLRAAAAA